MSIDKIVILVPGLLNTPNPNLPELNISIDELNKIYHVKKDNIPIYVVIHTWDNKNNKIVPFVNWINRKKNSQEIREFHMITEPYEKSFDIIANDCFPEINKRYVDFMLNQQKKWEDDRYKNGKTYPFESNDLSRRHLAIYYSLHKSYVLAKNNLKMSRQTLIIRSKPNTRFTFQYKRLGEIMQSRRQDVGVGRFESQPSYDNLLFLPNSIMDPDGIIKANENNFGAFYPVWEKIMGGDDTIDFLKNKIAPIYIKHYNQGMKIASQHNSIPYPSGSSVFGEYFSSQGLWIANSIITCSVQSRYVKKNDFY